MHSNDTDAVSALSAALSANDNDQLDDAKEMANVASRLFAQKHNLGGELWANFAEVYAYQRKQAGSDCLRTANALDHRLANTTYHWLQGQLALEKAICRNFSGDLSESEIDQDIKNSKQIAEDFGFPVLHVRILGIVPGIMRQSSETCEQKWEKVVAGLDEYWKGTYSQEGLYQFYSVLAQCAEQQNQWHEAKAFIEGVIEMRLSMPKPDPDLNILGALYLHLVTIQTNLQDDKGAEIAAKKAEAILKEPTFALPTKITLAECQLRRKRPEAALTTLESAKDLLSQVDDQLTQIDFRRVMGKVRFQLSQLDAAEQEDKLGLEMAEQSLGTLKHADDRMKWAEKTEELYRGLVQIWLEKGRVVDAWKLCEWAKTRSLVGGEPLRTAGMRTSWSQLEKAILMLPVPEGPEVRIVYVVFADRLHVWTVANHKVYSNWIELKRAELEKLVDDFAGQCADRFSPLPELQEQGGKLFSLLVQPVMDKLDEKQPVVFEADQRLWKLPIKALWTLDHRYLLEQFDIEHSPGILVEKTLRKPGGMHPQNALLQVESIPGFGPDLAGIANRFIHPEIINGGTATAPQIRAAAMKSDIFFFFGHAEPKGRGTILRVNDRTTMDSQDFTPVVLSHLSTAVLAACSTGATGQFGPLDTHSLVFAFLAGKVPNVVASQWDVETSSTVHLMSNIFQNSLNGDLVGQAVTNAQREYLVSHPQGMERHPYYWAGFITIGRIN